MHIAVRSTAPGDVRLPLRGVRPRGDGVGALQEGGQAGGGAPHAAAAVAPRTRRAAALRRSRSQHARGPYDGAGAGGRAQLRGAAARAVRGVPPGRRGVRAGGRHGPAAPAPLHRARAHRPARARRHLHHQEDGAPAGGRGAVLLPAREPGPRHARLQRGGRAGARAREGHGALRRRRRGAAPPRPRPEGVRVPPRPHRAPRRLRRAPGPLRRPRVRPPAGAGGGAGRAGARALAVARQRAGGRGGGAARARGAEHAGRAARADAVGLRARAHVRGQHGGGGGADGAGLRAARAALRRRRRGARTTRRCQILIIPTTRISFNSVCYTLIYTNLDID